MSETILNLDDAKLAPEEDLDRLRNRAWLIGGVAAVLLIAGYFVGGEDKTDFFRAYLIGWLLTLGVAAGLAALNMLNHLSGGDWGVVMRRVFEASGRTLPVFLVLGLPIAFGLESLYPWAHEGVTEIGHENYDALIAHKAPFLNETMFFVSSAAYILIWSALAYIISGYSRRQDQNPDDEDLRKKMAGFSAAGLILYILTGTVASVHWIMSTDPHWFSSLFGVAFVQGHALSAFALSVPLLVFLVRRKPFSEHVPGPMITKLFHDYGKLMLAFVALWAYFAVSQFLIIWSGNLPEEVGWYLDRSTHGWQLISVMLVFGQFLVPFVVLLSQDLKKKPGRLMIVAFWLLLMRWFDLYWQITPSVAHHTHAEHVIFSWLDVVAPVALFGLWLGLMVSQLKNRAMLPVGEPALKEVVAHG